MTILEIISYIPQPIIWIMGIIMLGYFIFWIIKKLMNRGDEEDEEDPKDEIGIPEVSFEEAGGKK